MGELIYALPPIGNRATITLVYGGGSPASALVWARVPAARSGPLGISPASARNWRVASPRYQGAFRGWPSASPRPQSWRGRRGAARGAACRNATDAPGRG